MAHRVDIQVPQDGQRIDLVHIDLNNGMCAPELRQRLPQILPRTVDGNDAGGMIPNA